MKHLFFILLVLILPNYGSSQPVPSCSWPYYSRMYIKPYQDLFYGAGMHIVGSYTLYSDRINCGDVSYFEGIARILFVKIELFKDIEEYEKSYHKNMPAEIMRIYITNPQWNENDCIVNNTLPMIKYYCKEQFAYYLEIPEFHNGDIWIDVSKVPENNTVLLPCGNNMWYDCETPHIPILNITPIEYEKPPSVIMRNDNEKAIMDSTGTLKYYRDRKKF